MLIFLSNYKVQMTIYTQVKLVKLI